MEQVNGLEHQGKVALVTGAARGLGRGFAEALAHNGAAAMIADIDLPAAKETATAIIASGGRASAVACDVSDEAAVESAVAATHDQFGGLDILINNAGLLTAHYSRGFSELPRDDVRKCLDVNIMGIVNCAVAARPFLARSGQGVIINIASTAGYLVPGPYGLSKLAVRGLTVALAREFAPDAIRVNAVAPGLTATNTVMDDQPEEFISLFVGELQLIKRLGQPKDIVDVVMFLSSARASFITGETLRVSGGYPLEV